MVVYHERCPTIQSNYLTLTDDLRFIVVRRTVLEDDYADASPREIVGAPMYMAQPAALCDGNLATLPQLTRNHATLDSTDTHAAPASSRLVPGPLRIQLRMRSLCGLVVKRPTFGFEIRTHEGSNCCFEWSSCQFHQRCGSILHANCLIATEQCVSTSIGHPVTKRVDALDIGGIHLISKQWVISEVLQMVYIISPSTKQATREIYECLLS